MAAIQQSWPARAVQSPAGALIAARPRNPASGATRPEEPQSCGRVAKKLKNAGVLHFSSRFFAPLHIDPFGAEIPL